MGSVSILKPSGWVILFIFFSASIIQGFTGFHIQGARLISMAVAILNSFLITPLIANGIPCIPIISSDIVSYLFFYCDCF